MFQPKAVVVFLHPIFSYKIHLTQKLAIFLLSSALLTNLIPASAQAASPSSSPQNLTPAYSLTGEGEPPLELSQKVEKIKAKLVDLKEKEATLNIKEEELKNIANYCCSNKVFQDQLDSQNAELEQAKTELKENQAQLEQDLKQNQLLLNGFQVAEEVRAATNWREYSNDLYDRIGYYGGVYSDCTWYAAEAVKVASAGHINLNNRSLGNWGNAGNWAWGAKNYAQRNPGGLVAGVDKTPRSGDVIEWPGGHVAFVENVAEFRDEAGKLIRYNLTISEESATGTATNKNSVRVKLNDPTGWVRRWRFNQTYNVSNGTEVIEGVRFIHFNYDGSWYN